MHQARLRARPIDDHPRSYPDGQLAVRVDDTDTWLLAAAARELEAHLLFERARQVADARALLVELYERDGVQVEDAVVDAQAEDVARLERGDRFLQGLDNHLQPGDELLALAGQMDDHTLGVWQEAAASLAEECPPTLAPLRWRVEETQRGELRSHAQLLRAETQLAARLRRFGLAGRLWHRRHVAVLGGQLADCRRRREQAGRRLALLDAKLRVIELTEQARTVWLTQAREVLTRGVAATQVLADRQQQHQVADRGGCPERPGTATGGVVTRNKTPARRCSWHHCSQPAAATVAFKLPNLLAGSRRDYCPAHTSQVRLAKGTVVVTQFSPRKPALPSSGDARLGHRTGRIVRTGGKGVVP
jgi:hypothetical protein